MNKSNFTSWEKVSDWYDQSVGESGHYYHQNIIIPKLLNYWKLSKEKNISILDLACGQGVLARHLPIGSKYIGIDVSPTFIQKAKQYNENTNHEFSIGDVTKSFKLPFKEFSHAAVILALQNIDNPEIVLKNAAQHLKNGGILSLVINHPSFRIPRQSSWGVDENKKLQYRRIESYMSPMEIPIHSNPGKSSQNQTTVSYHWPLSHLSQWLENQGFLITRIEEWNSDKLSDGAKAKMENRSRKEFPLFMAIHAIKK